MGLYSEGEEEDQVRDALRKRTAAEREQAFEEAAPAPAEFDPWAFAGLTRPGDEAPAQPQPTAPQTVPVDPTPSLFSGDADYLSAAVALTFPDAAAAIGWETDGPIVSFKPPDDLLRRLNALPQSYLRQRNLAERLRLTDDVGRADQSLAVDQRSASEETGTAWPEIHHLGPQHPVLEWIADKLLYRVGRDEAIAIACDVPDPVLLVSGVWSNKLGEPIASAWLAATVEDGLVTFEDMHSALANAGVRDRMVNPQWDGDIEDVRALVAPVVTAATGRLADDMQSQLTSVAARLDATRLRLDAWQTEARSVAADMKSEVHQRRRAQEIERTSRQMSALIADHTPADTPLVRIVGALLPSGRGAA